MVLTAGKSFADALALPVRALGAQEFAFRARPTLQGGADDVPEQTSSKEGVFFP